MTTLLLRTIKFKRELLPTTIAVAPSNTTADSADQAGQLQIGLAKKTRRFQELTFFCRKR